VGRTYSTHGSYGNAYECLVRKPGGRGQLEDTGAGGSLILTSILELTHFAHVSYDRLYSDTNAHLKVQVLEQSPYVSITVYWF
jgi:hypothetical protein